MVSTEYTAESEFKFIPKLRYVHHLSEDMKQVFKEAKIPVPLLSPARHAICDQSLDEDGHKICGAYKEQVTCASCHSNELPPSL